MVKPENVCSDIAPTLWRVYETATNYQNSLSKIMENGPWEFLSDVRNSLKAKNSDAFDQIILQ